MKRQFPTLDEAIAYLEKRGKLAFHGRVGDHYEICVYTLTIGIKVYHCNVHNNGLLEVVHERYKE